MANKLPTFAQNPNQQNIDSTIISNENEIKNSGFVPGTTIKASQINTYLRMLINATNGLVNVAIGTGDIKADSTIQEWTTYLSSMLKAKIQKESPTPVITNNDTGDNATIDFNISDQNYTKTINNVANAKSSEVAVKLQTPRNINISGDAIGTAQQFDGSKDIAISIDVKKSAALDSVNIGDSTHPVYFNTEGKPVKINKVAAAVMSEKTVWSGIDGIPTDITNLSNTIKTTKVDNATTSDTTNKVNVLNIGSATFTWNESSKILTIS